MVGIYIKNDEFIIEKEYTFDLIFSTLGIDYKFYRNDDEINQDDILIYYAPVLDKKFKNKFIWIKESNNLFNDNYLKSEPNYNIKILNLEKNIKSINNIISIFSNEDKLIEKNDNKFNIYIDIISDIFFMVTRYEEVICDEKDSHERFLLEKSISYKFSFLDRPIVNEQIEMILSLLKDLDKNIEKKNRWENKDFVFFLSHDIDSILKYRDKFIKTMGVKIIKEKDIKSSIEIFNNFLKVLRNKENDPYWKFDYLADIEEKYGMSASYYFMTGGKTSNDNYYNINNKILKNVFKRIENNSSEIGIHGSYNSYNDLNLLASEKSKIDKYTKSVGIRQHYLRFKTPDTWKVQQECNLKYDTTLGYAKNAGFRAGICTPYKPFNVLDRKVIDIFEIPLIVMDVTIAETQYMGLNPKEGIDYVKNLINRIIDVNGVFSLLWHNSNLDNSMWKDWLSVYEEIINYCIDNNALAISGKKIVDLYN
ncbi:polysaccharide deacetylase family protein [Clostridium nigeriense]|uniref:polysaccharide deacetylase family protein n=1 Tax=Clostridium nigeriense TaxID=1805470 RepID=UPI003D34739B